MSIPNALTWLRIILIPIFFLLFYLPTNWNYVVSSLVFTLAALTDVLDGYLARKLAQTSSFGRFLDPVADKLMVAVVLVLLVHRDHSIWLVLPASIIIGREIAVSALREWMAKLGARRRVAVSGLGKLKTIAQMVSLIFLIYQAPLLGIPVYTIGMILLYIAAILTLWSMAHYLLATWPEMKDK